MNEIMVLNWTTWVYVSLGALVPLSIAVIFLVKEYRRTKFQHSRYLLLGWVFIITWDIGGIFANLYLNVFLTIFITLMWIPIGIAVILLVDSVTRDSIDPLKLFFMGVLATALISSSINLENFPEIIFITGEKSIATRDSALVALSATLLFASLLYLYFTVKIHLNTPTHLKFYSRINILGALIMGIVNAIFEGTGLNYLIPGLVCVMLSIGALTMTIMFVREPKLAFILPFKALRLTVINESGLPLFNYNWNPSDAFIDDSLFSGMLQALTQFTKESINKGIIREIRLEHAVLLFQPSVNYSFTVVLLTTKTSRALRSGLNTFASEFNSNYGGYLADSVDVERFSGAESLVKNIFSFIPEYEQRV